MKSKKGRVSAWMSQKKHPSYSQNTRTVSKWYAKPNGPKKTSRRYYNTYELSTHDKNGKKKGTNPSRSARPHRSTTNKATSVAQRQSNSHGLIPIKIPITVPAPIKSEIHATTHSGYDTTSDHVDDKNPMHWHTPRAHKKKKYTACEVNKKTEHDT